MQFQTGEAVRTVGSPLDSMDMFFPLSPLRYINREVYATVWRLQVCIPHWSIDTLISIQILVLVSRRSRRIPVLTSNGASSHDLPFSLDSVTRT